MMHDQVTLELKNLIDKYGWHDVLGAISQLLYEQGDLNLSVKMLGMAERVKSGSCDSGSCDPKENKSCA